MWEVWAFVMKSRYQKNYNHIYSKRCTFLFSWIALWDLNQTFCFSHLKFQFDYDDKSSSSHSNSSVKSHENTDTIIKGWKYILTDFFLRCFIHSMINYDKILVYSSFFSAAAFPFGIIANTFSDTSSSFPFTWSKTGSIWASLFK